jgi:transcriptional regulator with XRE-family HTH domain
MTLEDFRLECQWSKNELARQSGLDFGTTNKAINGKSISLNTANKLAHAISRKLGRTIRIQDIEGLNISS